MVRVLASVPLLRPRFCYRVWCHVMCGVGLLLVFTLFVGLSLKIIRGHLIGCGKKWKIMHKFSTILCGRKWQLCRKKRQIMRKFLKLIKLFPWLFLTENFSPLWHVWHFAAICGQMFLRSMQSVFHGFHCWVCLKLSNQPLNRTRQTGQGKKKTNPGPSPEDAWNTWRFKIVYERKACLRHSFGLISSSEWSISLLFFAYMLQGCGGCGSRQIMWIHTTASCQMPCHNWYYTCYGWLHAQYMLDQPLTLLVNLPIHQ